MTRGGLVLTAPPVGKAVGLFRVKFKEDGVTVRSERYGYMGKFVKRARFRATRLLVLNRRGRLARDVVQHPVHTSDLVDDATAHCSQELWR